MPCSRAAAACRAVTPSGSTTTRSAGTTAYSAYAPRMLVYATRSPTLGSVTPGPTALRQGPRESSGDPPLGRCGIDVFRRRPVRRVVGVATRVAAVEGQAVGLVERRAKSEALHQVGVGEEQDAERDEIGFAARESRLC